MRPIVLVAVSIVLSSCGGSPAVHTAHSARRTVPPHQATLSQVDRASCASSVGPAPEIHGPTRLKPRPTDVILCGYLNGLPFKGRTTVTPIPLGAEAARTLVDLFNRAPAAAAPKPRCTAPLADVVLHFVHADGIEDAALAHFGCRKAAYLDGRARGVDPGIAGALTFDVSFQNRRRTGGVPNTVGLSVSVAERRARAAGMTLFLAGEVVDERVPDGRVALQAPPPGAVSDRQLEVFVARHSAPTCQVGQLAIDYLGGGAGMGNDFGGIAIRDVSADACTLRGAVRVAGTNRSGAVVTAVVAVGVRRGTVLTPRTKRLGPNHVISTGVGMASVRLAAEYRDDPSSPDGSCDAHQVIPASWQLTFADGRRSVRNYDAGGSKPFAGLVTCRGQLGTPEPIAIMND